MQIVILDGYTENPGDLSWESMQELGELTVYDRTPMDKIIERIGSADIVYTNKTSISRQVLEACPYISFIGVLATGYNVVDVEAAKERGIPVANIPTYGTAAVAQMTIAHLLEICHHVADHSRSVHEGEWANCPDFCYWNYPLIELAEKTLGIIGYGRIGRAVAGIARTLGMRVIVYDAFIKDGESVTLGTLFAEADVISMHCPMLPDTQGMINKDSITKMKDGVIILNTSRGALINEKDLAEALNNGKVYATGVDVVSSEPIALDNPLLEAKNCFITPHISWAPKESRQRLMDIAVDNLRQFLSGKPVNIVNSR